MEEFLGTWKFEKCEHFEEYLKALGISAPLRKLAMLTSPTVTIRESGEGERSHGNVRERSENTLDKFSITTDATVRSVTIEYKLGEKVEETTVGEYKAYFLLPHSAQIFSLDLRTVSSVLTFDTEKCCLILTSTDKYEPAQPSVLKLK